MSLNVTTMPYDMNFLSYIYCTHVFYMAAFYVQDKFPYRE